MEVSLEISTRKEEKSGGKKKKLNKICLQVWKTVFIMHCLRHSDEKFQGFGWKTHKKVTNLLSFQSENVDIQTCRWSKYRLMVKEPKQCEDVLSEFRT